MHFDDRLATVLRHRAAGERAARTQFRQLLDLLGRRKHGKDGSMLAAAWLRLGALGEAIPANDRAAMIRAPGARFENPELTAHFAEDEPVVAAAALAAADLSEEDWETLIPRLPIRARGFLRLRDDLPAGAQRLLDRLGVSDRALPLPDTSEPLVLTNEADSNGAPNNPPVHARNPEERRPDEYPARQAERVPSLKAANDADGDEDAATITPIAALVERIEAFQRSRAETKAAARETDPLLPFAEEPGPRAEDELPGFVFTADAEGRIDWAEDHMAAAIRYLQLRDVLGEQDAKALARRQPLQGVRVTLEGGAHLSGEWILEAAPCFAQPSGQFRGYAGRLRKPVDQDDPAASEQESDQIRQLLHELRTPVNAIQGFAEVIQQQLFGPVPHEYRALAASIAGDSARMLAGFDELDRLTKLESGLRELDEGECDFAAIISAQLDQLAAILRPRNAGFAARIEADCKAAMAQNEAEALVWRILAALSASLSPSETTPVILSSIQGMAVLECRLPAVLSQLDDVFATQVQKSSGGGALSAGAFGSGFALRLARAEARSVGGDLTRVEDQIVLTIPLLTVQPANSSQDASSQGAVRPGVS
ncbi:histidine kinase dimerization/phospho-acceptor domain-containing protein [Altererythrobacter sp.]|nr:histidine kinase dimerization/phospho-acceptor domain-containing protein [Altererythrobacter sp.]